MAFDILSANLFELTEYLSAMGQPSYRAKQIFREIHRGKTVGEITTLPKDLREKLNSEIEWRLPTVAKKLVSAKDGTVKYLFRLFDGECIESVFMRYEYGNTLCVSSQVGCRMGCKFCASTLAGKVRDLAPSEIVGQIIAAMSDMGERISHIVMMGIGEPLDNYDNVIRFLHLVSSPDGVGIGLRHISLSTCGVVPNILRLANEGLPVTLSISLHAYDNETRNAIMPVNRAYGLEQLLPACKTYFEKTGRRVSFEYTLIGGKNDSLAGADRLASVLRESVGAIAHVNLIPLNEVAETGLHAPSRENVNAFCERLHARGINATVRRRLGSDINASCGQLRRAESKKTEEQS